MGLFKRAVIISLFFLLSGTAHAQDLEINADSVSYDKDSGVFEASGEVVAKYKEMSINAPHLIYLSPVKMVFADRGFMLIEGDRIITGESLNYQIETRKGSAETVNVAFRRTRISGKSIILDPDIVTLDDSSFTTCDEKTPHYHITASTTIIHPKTGWLQTYWGWFFLGPLPLVPVPTYVFDFSNSRRHNTSPVPELGANDTDGWYGIERLGWSSNEQTYGTFSLAYAEKQGPGGGMDVNYVLDDENRYYARVGTYQNDGWWGGLTYTRFFGWDVEDETDKGNVSPSYGWLKEKKLAVDLDISSRERINYERVSLLPEISLIVNPDRINNFKYSGDISWARVFEESSQLDLYRTALFGKISYDIPLISTAILTLGGDCSGKWYSDASAWGNMNDFCEIGTQWNEISGSNLGYKHIMYNSGGSPFTYELYQFRVEDEMYSTSYIKLFSSRYGIYLDYYVPSLDPRNIDYFVSSTIHCFDITATYRAITHEFNIGIGFASN